MSHPGRSGRIRREWIRTATLLAVISGFEIGEEFSAQMVYAATFPFRRVDGVITTGSIVSALRWLSAEPKRVVKHNRKKRLWRRIK